MEDKYNDIIARFRAAGKDDEFIYNVLVNDHRINMNPSTARSVLGMASEESKKRGLSFRFCSGFRKPLQFSIKLWRFRATFSYSRG